MRIVFGALLLVFFVSESVSDVDNREMKLFSSAIYINAALNDVKDLMLDSKRSSVLFDERRGLSYEKIIIDSNNYKKLSVRMLNIATAKIKYIEKNTEYHKCEYLNLGSYLEYISEALEELAVCYKKSCKKSEFDSSKLDFYIGLIEVEKIIYKSCKFIKRK